MWANPRGDAKQNSSHRRAIFLPSVGDAPAYISSASLIFINTVTADRGRQACFEESVDTAGHAGALTWEPWDAYCSAIIDPELARRDTMANQQNQHGSTSSRGFASMDENKQREIASHGGGNNR